VTPAPIAPRRLAFFAAGSALTCGVALAVSLRVSSTALYGAGFATVAAAVSLPLVAWGCGRGTNALLGGFVAGFLARMLLVAAGLLASHAGGNAALQYAFAFFAVYAVTQVVEVAYVVSSSQSRRAGAS
jgi:hypothetical protein